MSTDPDQMETRLRGALREIAQSTKQHADASPFPGPNTANGHSDRSRLWAPALIAAGVVAVAAGAAALAGLPIGDDGSDSNSNLAAQSPASSPTSAEPRDDLAKKAEPSAPPVDGEGASRDDVIDVTEQFARLENRSGFGSVTVDYDSDTVTLRWAGQPPEDVRARLGQTETGVFVTLIETSYSRSELLAEGSRIAAKFPAVEITGWMTTKNLDGLVIDVVRPRPDTEGELQDASRVPIRVNALEEAIGDLAE